MKTGNLTKKYTTGFVTSKDGAKIGYRQFGSGPGVILVHGGLMASQNFTKLAEALSSEYTVYVPDRRGRGLSDTPVVNYGLNAESEDLQALITKTKAENIFGLSSGAIITLQTAISNPSLKKVALYEPPIPIKGTTPTDWFNDYELAITKENFGKALIIILKRIGDSSFLTLLPGFIVAPLVNIAINKSDKKVEGDDVTLKALIAAMRYDAKAVIEAEGIIEKCSAVNAEMLLLGGSRSQHYLKIALNELSIALPQAKRIEFPGLGHIAADNSEKPEVVAKELKLFFASKTISNN